MFKIDLEEAVIGAIVAAIIALLALAYVSSERENERWQAFKIAHQCKIVGYMDGETLVGVGPATNGKGGVAVTTTRTSDKAGWLCDDGVTYWKNK